MRYFPKHRFSFFHAASLLVVLAASILAVPSASAEVYTDVDGLRCDSENIVYGRPECTGYFEGQPRAGERPGMLRDGLYVENREEFISQMRGYLFGSDFRDVISAAMIIDVMLGKDGPEFGNSREAGVQYARDNFDRWADYITRLDNQNRIEWLYYYSPAEPYQNAGFDTVSRDISTRQFQATTIESIRFKLGGISTGGDFLIDRTCGNIKSGFESAPPPDVYNLEPLVEASETQAMRGETVSFEFNTRNDGPDRSQPTAWSVVELIFNSTPPAGALNGRDNGDCGDYQPPADGCRVLFNGAAREFDVGNTPLTGDVPANARTVQMNYPPGTSVCRILTIEKPTQNSSPRDRWSDAWCVTVAKRPNVHFLGGDIAVGHPFQTDTAGTSCAARPDTGSVYTYANSTTNGSVTEYAAFLQGLIDFQSSLNHGFGTGSRPGTDIDYIRQLGFANTPSGSTPNRVGQFGNERCMPDYFAKYKAELDGSSSERPAPANPVSFSATDTVYYNSGPVTIGRSAINNGADILVVVDGDVTITDNIFYRGSTPGYPNTASIPSFALIASGDIRIAENVTRLDGVYSSKQSIDTCYGPPARLTVSDCNQQLVINGAIITDKLALRRTYGGAGAAASQPAEVFNFGTELFFNNVLADTNPGQVRTMQQRDVPARF